MKLWIGFTAGFVAGAATYSKLTEEQRAGVAAKIDSLMHTGRTGDISTTVSSGVGDVADVVTERVTDATTAATSAVAGKLEKDAGANGTPSTSVPT